MVLKEKLISTTRDELALRLSSQILERSSAGSLWKAWKIVRAPVPSVDMIILDLKC
jgi:hypothetical protein